MHSSQDEPHKTRLFAYIYMYMRVVYIKLILVIAGKHKGYVPLRRDAAAAEIQGFVFPRRSERVIFVKIKPYTCLYIRVASLQMMRIQNLQRRANLRLSTTDGDDLAAWKVSQRGSISQGRASSTHACTQMPIAS